MLPEQDGFEVCERLRADGVTTPIIMLTARGQNLDRVKGLRLGADDYVPKPFDPLELLARIEAVLRRAPQPAALAVGLRPDRMAWQGEAGEVGLTSSEFRLLEALCARPGRVFTRAII